MAGGLKSSIVRTQHPAMLPGIAAVIVVIALLPYLQVKNFDFVAYDDNSYITENAIVQRGFTREGMGWAFSTFAASNWHPLTWLSHMLDCAMFKRDDGRQWAGGHHLVSAMLHALNASLLFGLLHRMSGGLWRSVFVAALFALHPLHVESVAWVSERKDVLSTFWGFAAMWFYIGFAKRGSVAPYALMLACFVLSLLAKPMFVTLPCVLLLLDWWPLRRWKASGGPSSATRLVTEKLPLFALAAASCIVTILAQRAGGAMFPLEAMPISARITNAVVAYASYIGLMFWPIDLAVLYPHPGSWETWRVTVSVIVLVAISALAGGLSRKRPEFAVGWLWYLGTLVPVIGLVQVGVQSMADRYTYVPLIGLFIMIAWAVPVIRSRKGLALAAASAMLIVGVLMWRSFEQVRYWRDSVTLFERTLAITNDNYIIHNNLGFAHKKDGRLDDAVRHYRAALEINPDYPLTHENLGNALVAAKQPDQAISHLKRAVDLRPDVARTRSNLGAAFFHTGRMHDAEQAFKAAIERDPQYVQAHINMGRLYVMQNRNSDAIAAFRAALAVDHHLPDVHMNLGVELAKQKKYDEAIAQFQLALKLKPDLVDAQKFIETVRLLREQEN